MNDEEIELSSKLSGKNAEVFRLFVKAFNQSRGKDLANSIMNALSSQMNQDNHITPEDVKSFIDDDRSMEIFMTVKINAHNNADVKSNRPLEATKAQLRTILAEYRDYYSKQNQRSKD